MPMPELDDDELEFTLDESEDDSNTGTTETSDTGTTGEESEYASTSEADKTGETGEDATGRENALTRGQTRHQRLANERNAALERATKAETEAAELKRIAAEQQQRNQANWMQQQQLAEQQRMQQAWDNGTTEDRVAMMLQHQQRQLQQQWAHTQMQAQDAADKAAYEAKAATNPVLAKLSTEVEARLIKARASGFNASRHDIAAHLIGEKVLARRNAASAAQRSASNANTQRQTVPARRSGSDQQSDRRGADNREARRKRLENMVF